MSPKVKSDHLFELLLSPYCEQVDHATEIEKGADYYLSFYRQKYGVTPGRIEVNSTMKEGGPDHVEKQLFTTDF
ncbi:hypothetical protein AGDE_13359 [Angomonas deanei]|uniref:Uncharacterized protein n=1 Tax=Angomonas deanei TaxID=59799 RepID=A0A7G2C751_9TRYP|nr:hypothetical protein AGDE_13359 [Angomonas deanei]CAD2214637.1 hypothetical protein, conserved [Angomonas deanei]|eukprot:EPY22399.1 hypothetical protein AGDE_13359 [Angomonas deanei]